MSVKTTAEKQQATPEEPHARAERLRQSLDGLNQSLAASQRRQTELTTERETLVLPARLNNDTDALKRLRAIDVDLATVRSDIADYGNSIAKVGKQLTAAEQDIERSEWERSRAKIRELLISRMKNRFGQKIQKAAQDLAVMLDAAKEEDEQLCAKVRAFEPRLSEAKELNFLHRFRQGGVSFDLRKQLEIDTRHFYGASPRELDLDGQEQEQIGEVIEALDRLQLVF